MYNPLVSIIIVNWNGIRYLKSCLGSLSKVRYKNKEILFVDNASADGSVEFVRRNFPSIKIIKNKKNLGYAEGHEGAFKMSKGELVLLLSTDTVVQPNLLDELVGAIKSESNIGIVMPKLLYPNKKTIDSIGSFLLSSGILYHFGRDKNQTIKKYNRPMDIFSGKGACLLCKKSVLERTGLFDNDYFAYFEETDLCHRVWLSGNKVIYWPNTSVLHVQGGSSKQMVRAFILFHSNKNIIATYIKNLSIKYLFKILPFILLIYQFAFWGYLLRFRIDIAWSFQKAIIWNLQHVGQTLKKRRFVQDKIRKISDEGFLPHIMRSVKPAYYFAVFMGKGLSSYKD